MHAHRVVIALWQSAYYHLIYNVCVCLYMNVYMYVCMYSKIPLI